MFLLFFLVLFSLCGKNLIVKLLAWLLYARCDYRSNNRNDFLLTFEIYFEIRANNLNKFGKGRNYSIKTLIYI